MFVASHNMLRCGCVELDMKKLPLQARRVLGLFFFVVWRVFMLYLYSSKA